MGDHGLPPDTGNCDDHGSEDAVQTARLLGCTTGTVKSQCARGLQTLRDLLDDTIPSQAEGAC
jgi:hypothetical protein